MCRDSNQLRDQVSERFIRECLDEKYKQRVRVENARKAKHPPQDERKLIDKLAVVPPLNQQEEEEKNKEVVILDVDGSTSIVREEDESFTPTSDSSTIDKTFTKQPYQQQPKQDLKKQIDYNHDSECPTCKELYNENCDLKQALEESSHLITADKIGLATASVYDKDTDTANDILPFEFFVIYNKLQKYMSSLFYSKSNSQQVWFNGIINKNTGIVVSSNLGRINQQLDNSIEIANMDDL